MLVPGGISAVLRLVPHGHRVAALPHVVDALSSMIFVDLSSRWTLDRAIDLELWDLLDSIISTLEQDESIIVLDEQARARRAMSRAAQKGALGVMQKLLDTFGCRLDENMVEAAARDGSMEVMQWLFENLEPLSEMEIGMFFPTDSVVTSAAGSGSLELVQWLVDMLTTRGGDHNSGDGGVAVTWTPIVEACKHGHLEVVKWILDQALPSLQIEFVIPSQTTKREPTQVQSVLGSDAVPDVEENSNLDSESNAEPSQSESLQPESAMDWAAAMGHLDVVQYLHERTQSPNACTVFAMDQAAANGHLEVVEWLHANRVEGCTTKAMDKAGEHGYLDVVRFLHETRTEGCTTLAMGGAAENGHLDVVCFLHEHRSEGCTSGAMDGAAANGHMGVVKFLHERRADGCTTEAMNGAAGNGHLEVVQFLHDHREEGCTAKAMDNAAGNGYLEVLRWLHENRSEGLERAMDLAMENGHVEVVKWLQIHHEDKEWSWNAPCFAAANGHFKIIQFVYQDRVKRTGPHEVGYDDEDYYNYCFNDDFENWTMSAAAENGHLKIVKFLDQFWLGECSRGGWTAAAENGHLEVVKWLCENRTEGFFARGFDTIASNGDLTMLELLHANDDLHIFEPPGDEYGIPQGGFQDIDEDPWSWGKVSIDTFYSAIKGNQVEAVEWLSEKYPELLDLVALRRYAENHQRACILRWVEEIMHSEQKFSSD